ncbi:U-box domain-containing protein 33-like isoform X3 [Carex rostrata]
MDESGQVEKVYVALPERLNDGRNTLSWVLNHFSKDTNIIITHVHIPTQMIPMMGTKFPANQLSPHQVNSYRKKEWENAENHLNDYLLQCSNAKFKAEKLMFVSDHVAHALVELVTLHGMSNLVMGAASDKRYSRGITELKSNKAKIVMEKAHPSCKIFFTYNGSLVCTREPALLPTEALNQVSSMPMESNRQTELPRRSSFNVSNLRVGEIIPGFLPQSPNQPSHQKCDNYLIDFSERATASDAASSIASEEGHANYDMLSLNRDDDLDVGSLHKPHLSQGSTRAHEQFFQGNIAGICTKLQAALVDAAKYRVQLNEEICKRERAEMDLASLIQKAEEMQNALLKEKQEMEFLHKEIERGKSRLDLLQEENKKLQEEKNIAVKELEELRNGAGCGSYGAFSEFSLLELQRATDNFSDSHKIGEGGFGCVYKGFLRNTMVAIKMLHPESLQGRLEFEREVAILSTMRHPNLVTLIGTCSEQSALVYEYLPNGSLEDRLTREGGTPPLTWQVRTRIIGEICRALLFLHLNNPNPIVHGDLKPANILLDANLVSKLSDFGLSRLLMKSNTNTSVYRTENLRGTFAYMDPEFLSSGEITVKSDVYSFGIIVLRLLTGKLPVNIAADVEGAIATDSLHLIIDESAGEWPFVQAKQLANLGLRCAQMRRRKRPDMESEWKFVESLMMAASLSELPSFRSQLDDRGIPSYFRCPIFKKVMKDPHIAADGYTYEAEAIKDWLDSGHKTSPMTNLPLVHLELTPNHALCSAIQEWLLGHP